MREPRRALVVEPDPRAREAIRRWLARGWGLATEARAVPPEPWPDGPERAPDVVVLSLDGVADAEARVRRAAGLRPAPVILATCTSLDAPCALRLGALGVRAVLCHPFGREALLAELAAALERPPELAPLLRAAVGHRGLGDVLQLVRRVMFEQALALAGDNRSEAGRLLAVSRQAVQQAARSGLAQRDAAPPEEPGARADPEVRRTA